MSEGRILLTKRTLRAVIDACRDSDDPEIRRAEKWARQEAQRRAARTCQPVHEYLGYMAPSPTGEAPNE